MYQFYLLENLSAVKSILIMTELDDAESMTTELFIQFFDTVGKKLSRNVQSCMTDILTQLIEETSISQEVIELLLQNLITKDDDTRDPAHNMALDITRATSDIIQRRVCQVIIILIIIYKIGIKIK